MLKTSYETKTDIPEALAEYYTEKNGAFILQVEGIENINSVDKTLKEIRKAARDAEQKVKSYEDKYSLLPDDFDITEYNRLKDTNQSGDIDAKLKEQRDRITSQYEKEKKTLLEQIAEKDNLVHTHVKSATLNRAMAEAGIAKPFIPAVEALMQSRIKIEGTDVYLDEKPVSQALKEWVQSEEGKYYVAAADNAGGGSNTSKASGDSAKKTMTRSDFEGLSIDKKMEVSKAGVDLTD